MKKSRKTRYCPSYPNEADRNYILQRVTDAVTAVISSMGLIIAMVFLTLFL